MYRSCFHLFGCNIYRIRRHCLEPNLAIIPFPIYSTPILTHLFVFHMIQFGSLQGLSNPHIKFIGVNQINGIAFYLGIATHKLTTILSSKLLCSANSTKHVVPFGNLMLHPRTVIAEFQGIKMGCCFLLIVTCPISPSSLMEDGQALHFQHIIFVYAKVVVHPKLGEREVVQLPPNM